jgi:hypothetical protein
VAQLDLKVKYSRCIDGTEYIPGTVGLNNLKNTAYLNVIVQVAAPAGSVALQAPSSCFIGVLAARPAARARG